MSDNNKLKKYLFIDEKPPITTAPIRIAPKQGDKNWDAEKYINGEWKQYWDTKRNYSNIKYVIQALSTTVTTEHLGCPLSEFNARYQAIAKELGDRCEVVWMEAGEAPIIDKSSTENTEELIDPLEIDGFGDFSDGFGDGFEAQI